MKAITLWQPWASLVAVGAKKIETRSWPTNYRGPLAIHAAALWNNELRHQLSFWHIQSGLAPLVGKPIDFKFKTWSGVDESHLPRGVVIATCELVDCIPMSEMTLGMIGTDKLFGDFSLGRFAWMLQNVKALDKPIPAKGGQRLWNWDGEVGG